MTTDREARFTDDRRRQRWVRKLLDDWRADTAGKPSLEGRASDLIHHLMTAAGYYDPKENHDETTDALLDVLEHGEPGPRRFVKSLRGKVACAHCYRPCMALPPDWLCHECLTAPAKPPAPPSAPEPDPELPLAPLSPPPGFDL